MISQPVDINMFSESVTLLSLGTGGFTRVDHFSVIQAIALAKKLYIHQQTVLVKLIISLVEYEDVC